MGITFILISILAAHSYVSFQETDTWSTNPEVLSFYKVYKAYFNILKNEQTTATKEIMHMVLKKTNFYLGVSEKDKALSGTNGDNFAHV